MGFRVVAVAPEKANSIPAGPTAPIVDPTPEPTPEPTPTPEPSPTPAPEPTPKPKPTPNLIALPSPCIVDSIAPSDLQPNTKEFLAARAAYVEANNKYHEANNQYLAGYVSYKEVQDKYAGIYSKLIPICNQYLAAYQQKGKEDPAFLKLQPKFNDLYSQAGALWADHLASVDKRIHEDRNQRDQAEQDYSVAQSHYLEACYQAGHIEDQYDQTINQYNQAIQTYIKIAYPFFELEGSFGDILGNYAYSTWLYVTDYETTTPGSQEQIRLITYSSNTIDQFNSLNPEYQQKLLEFKEAQQKYNTSLLDLGNF